MKALGVLESKWNPIRQKLVRRLLEEQDKVSRSYFAQKGGTEVKGGKGLMATVGSMSNGTCGRTATMHLIIYESFRAG
jgi:hypothetical protein